MTPQETLAAMLGIEPSKVGSINLTYQADSLPVRVTGISGIEFASGARYPSMVFQVSATERIGRKLSVDDVDGLRMMSADVTDAEFHVFTVALIRHPKTKQLINSFAEYL